ncbi:hypothetical protein FA13DRAFT_83149 [Coprinellus micaceus]|uniref:F-box domain-containing protein n=1 Tax=Coprinellus micaceus TaxID=71717 RepID=A0A4Y7TJL3_COPMI|nr:hypothetical protein FA13DRAFT_489670 [Coprinellus micaceus]TEB34373.1 hypothetical protein FA13DRAFT_83149 [Coprinellus micaceus]
MSKSASDSCEQPLAAGDGLPIEIWRQIHQHIPPTESPRLYEVNRAFFRLEMSRNYDCIHLGRPLSKGRPDRWVHALRYARPICSGIVLGLRYR